MRVTLSAALVRASCASRTSPSWSSGTRAIIASSTRAALELLHPALNAMVAPNASPITQCRFVLFWNMLSIPRPRR